MKKWCFLLTTLFACTFNYASEPEMIEVLSSKVILQNTEGYFALSNGTCWKVMGFSPRWRTPSEWWNNVQIVPENYKSIPNDWLIGTQVEIYPTYGNLTVSLNNASNEESLMQCTHLLLNTRTGQVLFALSMHPAQCLTDLAKATYEDGHAKGFIEGRSQQFKNTKESYNQGHSAGYKEGYTQGYADGIKN